MADPNNVEPLSTDQLRAKASNWTLAGDAGLLAHLQSFSNVILSKAEAAEKSLHSLSDSVEEATANFNNVSNQFLSLQNSQFMENRVYDEETPTDEKRPPDPIVEETQQQTLTRYKDSVSAGISLLHSHYEEIEVVESSDSEDEATGSSRVSLWRPKPVYTNPLPLLIGSAEWWTDDNVGLGEFAENKDSDSEELESESDAELPETVEKRVKKSLSSTDSSQEVESPSSNLQTVPQPSAIRVQPINQSSNLFKPPTNQGSDLFKPPTNQNSDLFKPSRDPEPILGYGKDLFGASSSNLFDDVPPPLSSAKIDADGDSLFGEQQDEEEEQEVAPKPVNAKVPSAFTKELAARLGNVAKNPQVDIKEPDKKQTAKSTSSSVSSSKSKTTVQPAARTTKSSSGGLFDDDEPPLFKNPSSVTRQTNSGRLFDDDPPVLKKSSTGGLFDDDSASLFDDDVPSKSKPSAVPRSSKTASGGLFDDEPSDIFKSTSSSSKASTGLFHDSPKPTSSAVKKPAAKSGGLFDDDPPELFSSEVKKSGGLFDDEPPKLSSGIKKSGGLFNDEPHKPSSSGVKKSGGLFDGEPPKLTPSGVKKSVGLFDDEPPELSSSGVKKSGGLFDDDIDDEGLFSSARKSNVANVRATGPAALGLFDDDPAADDLFSGVKAKSVEKKSSTAGKSNVSASKPMDKSKSLFGEDLFADDDGDEGDLFAPAKPSSSKPAIKVTFPRLLTAEGNSNNDVSPLPSALPKSSTPMAITGDLFDEISQIDEQSPAVAVVNVPEAEVADASANSRDEYNDAFHESQSVVSQDCIEVSGPGCDPSNPVSSNGGSPANWFHPQLSSTQAYDSSGYRTNNIWSGAESNQSQALGRSETDQPSMKDDDTSRPKPRVQVLPPIEDDEDLFSSAIQYNSQTTISSIDKSSTPPKKDAPKVTPRSASKSNSLFADPDDNSLFEGGKSKDNISVSSSRSSLFEEPAAAKSALTSIFGAKAKEPPKSLFDDLDEDDLFSNPPKAASKVEKKVLFADDSDDDLFKSSAGSKQKGREKPLKPKLLDKGSQEKKGSSELAKNKSDLFGNTDDFFGPKSPIVNDSAAVPSKKFAHVQNKVEEDLFKNTQSPLSAEVKESKPVVQDKSAPLEDDLFMSTNASKSKEAEPAAQKLRATEEDDLFKSASTPRSKEAKLAAVEDDLFKSLSMSKGQETKPLAPNASETVEDDLFKTLSTARSKETKPAARNTSATIIEEPLKTAKEVKPLVKTQTVSTADDLLKSGNSSVSSEVKEVRPAVANRNAIVEDDLFKSTNASQSRDAKLESAAPEDNIFKKMSIPKVEKTKKYDDIFKSDPEDDDLFNNPKNSSESSRSVVNPTKSVDYSLADNNKSKTDEENLGTLSKDVSKPTTAVDDLFKSENQDNTRAVANSPNNSIEPELKTESKPKPPDSLKILKPLTKEVTNSDEPDGEVLIAPEPKKIGKLKIPMNINPAALLPGAKLKKPPPSEVPEDSLKAPERTVGKLNISPNLVINPASLLPGAKLAKPSEEPKKSQEDTTPESDSTSTLLVSSAQKNRVRGPVKRRPQSKRARQEALRTSGIDFGDFNDEPANPEPVTSPAITSNLLSPSTDEDDCFQVPELEPDQEDQLFKSDHSKTDHLLFDKAPILSPLDNLKTPEVFVTPKDTFSSSSTPSSVLYPGKLKPNNTPNLLEAKSPLEDSYFTPKETFSENVSPASSLANHVVPKPSLQNIPSQDSDEELFSAKPKQKTDVSIFDDEPPPLRKMSFSQGKPSLFGDSDDDDDDIFSASVSVPPPPVISKNTEPPKLSKPSSVPDVENNSQVKEAFVDPLGYLQQD